MLGTGQWFLIALLEGYIFFWLAYRVKLGKFLERYGLWVACLLLVFHIPVRIVLMRNNVRQLLGVNPAESFFVRNVWFDALPFMLIGINMRTHDFKTKSRRLLPIISFAALLLSVGEMYLTKAITTNIQMASVLYVGTIVSVVSAFAWAIANNEKNLKVFLRPMEYIGRNLSMIVFFIHPIVGNYLEFIAKKSGGNPSIAPSGIRGINNNINIICCFPCRRSSCYK